MRAHFVGFPVFLVIGLAILIGDGRRAAAQDPKDFDAIQQVIQKFVGTVNDPAFSKATRERRVEMLRPYYRPDTGFSREDLPVFFGPLSEPVSRGATAHLDNTSLNFDWLFRQGLTYGLRVDDSQIELGGNLAVVLASTTSGFSSADGKTNYATRGRATIVLNKTANGQWLIGHEHLELYNADNNAILSKARLSGEIDKLKK